MPPKSKSQFRWSFAAEKRGDISHAEAREIRGSAKYSKLPEKKSDGKRRADAIKKASKGHHAR